jgi:hypothetical protein
MGNFGWLIKCLETIKIKKNSLKTYTKACAISKKKGGITEIGKKNLKNHAMSIYKQGTS